MIDQWRRFVARLFITGLSSAYLVIRLALHGIAAISGFFNTWPSTPRSSSGSLPSLAAAPVRVIDGFDRGLRRATRPTGRVLHAAQSPLQRALETLANRIAAVDQDRYRAS